MNDLHAPLEALLLMAEEPMPATMLAQVLEVPVDDITTSLGELAAFYDETGRGFELRHVGGGWRYYTRDQHADVLTRYVLDGQQGRLSQAALETLAVVAYLQPISRTRVSAVRGVNVDGVVRTLAARGLIEEAGQDETTGAVVFRTTDYFLERMGLTSLDELPDLAPHLPETAELEAELGALVDQRPPEPAPEADPEPEADPKPDADSQPAPTSQESHD